MVWITVIIAGYILLGAISGYRRGLVAVAFSLAGYAVGVIVALHYQNMASHKVLAVLPITQWIHQIMPAQTTSIPGAASQALRLGQELIRILVFLVIVGLVEWVGRLVGQMGTRVVRGLGLTRAMNAVGGMAFGVAENVAVTTLVVGLMATLPMVSHTPLVQDLRTNPVTTQMVTWFVHWDKLGGSRLL